MRCLALYELVILAPKFTYFSAAPPHRLYADWFLLFIGI